MLDLELMVQVEQMKREMVDYPHAARQAQLSREFDLLKRAAHRVPRQGGLSWWVGNRLTSVGQRLAGGTASAPLT